LGEKKKIMLPCQGDILPEKPGLKPLKTNKRKKKKKKEKSAYFSNYRGGERKGKRHLTRVQTIGNQGRREKKKKKEKKM